MHIAICAAIPRRQVSLASRLECESGSVGAESDFWGRQHIPLHLGRTLSEGRASNINGAATIINMSSKASPRISARGNIPLR
jgi:hypothetical protein